MRTTTQLSYVNEVNSLIVMAVVLIKYKVTRLLNIPKSQIFSKWTACTYVVQLFRLQALHGGKTAQRLPSNVEKQVENNLHLVLTSILSDPISSGQC